MRIRTIWKFEKYTWGLILEQYFENKFCYFIHTTLGCFYVTDKLRWGWDWGWGWFDPEVEVRLNWSWGWWDAIELKFSWSWVKLRLNHGENWVHLWLPRALMGFHRVRVIVQTNLYVYWYSRGTFAFYVSFNSYF